MSPKHFFLGLCALTLVTPIACRSTQSSVLRNENAEDRSSLTFSPELLQNSTTPFLTHISSDPMQNYLAMNIQYQPVEELREELQRLLPYTLKNRGEAHITVVNPVEYKNRLMNKLSMTAIHEIAKSKAIQSSDFEAVCLGEGQKELDGVVEHTWFIVVRSPQLLNLRAEIQKAFVAAGGEKEAFDYQLFYPHITLGFTKRDLHFEDGVIKDERSCVYPLAVQE